MAVFHKVLYPAGTDEEAMRPSKRKKISDGEEVPYPGIQLGELQEDIILLKRVIGNLSDGVYDLKKEVKMWKRLYNQMGVRNEKLQNQVNDLRTRMEELEAYIGALKRFLPWVVKK